MTTTPDGPVADTREPWPTHCEHCGTALQPEVLDELVTNDWNEGTPMPVLAQDVCPNPNCRSKHPISE